MGICQFLDKGSRYLHGQKSNLGKSYIWVGHGLHYQEFMEASAEICLDPTLVH
jgi:hypothetical protein